MDNLDIVKSICKKYKKEIWSRFNKAIKEFELISENDKIMVCISGGKDSMLLAKCMEELQKHSYYKFDLEYLVMNPGYREENMDLLKENLDKLNINAHIVDSDIFQVCDKLSRDNPCYLCARMRRGFLYNKAQELGCNKIALGHHFDDVIETIMLNILYAGEYKSMMPKLKSTNFPGIELIRPFYYVHEEDIKSWVNYMNLKFLDCACSITKGEVSSKRKEVKELIKSLKKENENVDIHILRSSFNVNLDSVIGYKKKNKEYDFKDEY